MFNLTSSYGLLFNSSDQIFFDPQSTESTLEHSTYDSQNAYQEIELSEETETENANYLEEDPATDERCSRKPRAKQVSWAKGLTEDEVMDATYWILNQKHPECLNEKDYNTFKEIFLKCKGIPSKIVKELHNREITHTTTGTKINATWVSDFLSHARQKPPKTFNPNNFKKATTSEELSETSLSVDDSEKGSPMPSDDELTCSTVSAEVEGSSSPRMHNEKMLSWKKKLTKKDLIAATIWLIKKKNWNQFETKENLNQFINFYRENRGNIPNTVMNLVSANIKNKKHKEITNIWLTRCINNIRKTSRLPESFNYKDFISDSGPTTTAITALNRQQDSSSNDIEEIDSANLEDATTPITTSTHSAEHTINSLTVEYSGQHRKNKRRRHEVEKDTHLISTTTTTSNYLEEDPATDEPYNRKSRAQHVSWAEDLTKDEVMDATYWILNHKRPHCLKKNDYNLFKEIFLKCKGIPSKIAEELHNREITHTTTRTEINATWVRYFLGTARQRPPKTFNPNSFKKTTTSEELSETSLSVDYSEKDSPVPSDDALTCPTVSAEVEELSPLSPDEKNLKWTKKLRKKELTEATICLIDKKNWNLFATNDGLKQFIDLYRANVGNIPNTVKSLVSANIKNYKGETITNSWLGTCINNIRRVSSLPYSFNYKDFISDSRSTTSAITALNRQQNSSSLNTEEIGSTNLEDATTTITTSTHSAEHTINSLTEDNSTQHGKNKRRRLEVENDLYPITTTTTTTSNSRTDTAMQEEPLVGSVSISFDELTQEEKILATYDLISLYFKNKELSVIKKKHQKNFKVIYRVTRGDFDRMMELLTLNGINERSNGSKIYKEWLEFFIELCQTELPKDFDLNKYKKT